MKARPAAVAGALCLVGLVACRVPAVGTVVQQDLRAPQPWRTLSAAERTQFDLGYAAFNTQWAAASASGGRTDGLGPVFNVPSCDACHNSRRRGRGPRGEGEAPADLVIQLGRVRADGSVGRGTVEYGYVLNPAAVEGFTPEASIAIAYTQSVRTLPDGSTVSLRIPEYRVGSFSGPGLADSTVIMPRMPPSLFGVGLLERVPESALVSLERLARRRDPSARVSRLHGGESIGRFGWQATEPTVASQTAVAFAREMGLSTTLISRDDCGEAAAACRGAPNGGAPEVDSTLFDALVVFQSLHAVPVATPGTQRDAAAAVFDRVGCAGCHRPTLPVTPGVHRTSVIRPFTDLLLHDLGEGLADRDLAGNPVRSAWRTAPLWGINAAVASGQPLRLLHDGRARSIEEAILWHAGAASASRERFEQLTAGERRTLIEWISRL